MFAEDFGESIWRDWAPGATVQGVLIRGGKRLSMTIFPDGTVEEEEEEQTESHASTVYRRSVRTGMRPDSFFGLGFRV